jgi:light-regulated signal transduction histidine kinase (bacteriophytochrome)
VRNLGLHFGYSSVVAKSSDGKIWFVPFGGVSIIDPPHLSFNELPGPVHIEQITADRQTYDAAQGVSVSDTGVGLPDKMDQIFNSFFTTKPVGTGMGLSITRSIVESHGGRLWAANNNGRGAIFHFTLPIEPRDLGYTADE